MIEALRQKKYLQFVLLLVVFALLCIGTEITRGTLASLRGAVLVQGLLLWAIVVPVTLGLIILLV